MTWRRAGWGEYEWECTELAFRFMAQIYGVSAYSANGNGVVRNYRASDGGNLQVVNNGTVGGAPTPGDVISFDNPNGLGHVAVVAASAVNGSGNGSVTLLSQNDTTNGWRVLAVSGWHVQGFGNNTPYGWLHDPAGRGGGGGFPDGTFVRTPNGNIYRIAGGAPLWISNCAPLGGCPYVSVPDLSQFRSRPADGTYIATAETGRLYVAAGGAPLWLGACPGDSCPYVLVNQTTIDVLDHLNSVPADGTFLATFDRGRVYTVAGGAPLWLGACPPSGCPYVWVDQSVISRLDHLREVPANGTFLRAFDTGRIYRIAGGAPLWLNSCAPLGGCGQPVAIDQSVIGRLDHLYAVPASGTFVRAAETGRIYRVAGGAPLWLDDCTYLGGCPGWVDVSQWTIDQHDHSVAVPADQTVLQGQPSGLFWRIVSGVRSLVPPPQANAVAVTDHAVEQFPEQGPPPPAPPPPPPPPPPFTPPKCVVPNVLGKPLSRAKTSVSRHHCRTGRISRAYSTKLRKGHVLAQRPHAGKRLANRGRVNLVVSRGRRR